jgi:ATP-binding cassette subfamily B protein
MVNFLRQVLTFTFIWLIFRDVISTGQMITLQFYSFFIFGPLQEIGAIIISYREAEASLNNFDNLMKREVELRPETPKNIGIIEELEFSNVTFQHRTAQFKALDNISFDVKKGETIAFVGPIRLRKKYTCKIVGGFI